MRIATLRKRTQFQRVRGGGRYSGPAFVLEGKARPSGEGEAECGPRFGFTVTKKLGGAVVRNRIRRRLKAAIAAVGASGADPAFDYVVVAREAALACPFENLTSDLGKAFRRVNATARKLPGGPAQPQPHRRQPAARPASQEP